MEGLGAILEEQEWDAGQDKQEEEQRCEAKTLNEGSEARTARTTSIEVVRNGDGREEDDRAAEHGASSVPPFRRVEVVPQVDADCRSNRERNLQRPGKCSSQVRGAAGRYAYDHHHHDEKTDRAA